jgi:hypothetical protein
MFATSEQCVRRHPIAKTVIPMRLPKDLNVPSQINDACGTIAVGVTRVAFCYFISPSLLLNFRVGIKKIKSVPKVYCTYDFIPSLFIIIF